MTTLPHTRHLDALVAIHVAKLPDVRLGIMSYWYNDGDCGHDAHPYNPSITYRAESYRDYVYKAREPGLINGWNYDDGYEPVPRYSTDGNDMLGLVEALNKSHIWIVHADNWRGTPSTEYAITLSCGDWKSLGRATTMPEAVAMAAANWIEGVQRRAGDQHWEVRRELARLVDEARAAGVEVEGQKGATRCQ